MDRLTSRQIAHQTQLERLFNSQIRKTGDIQRDIALFIRGVLSEYDEIATIATRNQINRQMREGLFAILANYDSLIAESNALIAEAETDFQARIVKNLSGQDVDIDGQSIVDSVPKQYAPLGSAGASITLDQATRSVTSATVAGVTGLVITAQTQGQTIQELTRTLTGTTRGRFMDGFTGNVKRSMDVVLRANMKIAETESKEKIFKEVETDGYIYSAILDSRTTPICKSLDGTIVLWSDDYQPKPPQHYGCRSTMLPYFEGETEVDQTYYEWLKEQPAAFQDEALGRERGLIFRNSGLTPEEFRKASVGGMNRPLTIKEMKAKNKEIADYLD